MSKTLFVSQEGLVLKAKRVVDIQEAMHWVDEHAETLPDDVQVIVEDDQTAEVVRISVAA